MAVNHFPPQAYTREMLATAYEWLRSQPQSLRELAKDSDSLVALYLQSRRRNEFRAEYKNAAHKNEPPVESSETFKSDLRNLAEGLKQFEEPQLNYQIPQTLINSPKAQSPSQTQTHAQIQPQQIPAQTQQNTSHSVPNPGSTPGHIFTPPIVNSPSQVLPQNSPYPAQQTFSQNQTYPSQNVMPQSQQTLVQPHSPNAANPQTYSTGHTANYVSNSTALSLLDPYTREKVRSIQTKLNLSSETEALRALIAIGYDQIAQWLPKN